MSRISLRRPYATVTVAGRALPIVGVDLTVGRYHKADFGSFQLPDDFRWAADETYPAPYSPVTVEMGYADEPTTVRQFSMFTSDTPARNGMIDIKDKWFELGAKFMLLTGKVSYKNVTLDQVVRHVLTFAGVRDIYVGQYAIVKPMWNGYNMTVQQAIEQASQDWGVQPPIFFDRAGGFFFGAEISASAFSKPTTTTFVERQNIMGQPEADTRRLSYDMIETGAEPTIGQQWDEVHQEQEIPYWRLPVVFAPWIWHGDTVRVDHSRLSGTFRVASASHGSRPWGTVLELEKIA